jgi:hypothetical protein
MSEDEHKVLQFQDGVERQKERDFLVIRLKEKLIDLTERKDVIRDALVNPLESERVAFEEAEKTLDQKIIRARELMANIKGHSLEEIREFFGE